MVKLYREAVLIRAQQKPPICDICDKTDIDHSVYICHKLSHKDKHRRIVAVLCLECTKKYKKLEEDKQRELIEKIVEDRGYI